MRNSYFITAIDTDAGKSIVTGLLALYLSELGVRVITQKMAQTGCTGRSEDIETHRRIMGIPLLPEDESGLTCPYLFPFPAAPQLSAELEGTEISFEKIREATVRLEEKYDCVLTEGVGGLMVPMSDDLTVLDYLRQYSQPVLLVTNGKLGSVNHTLLSLEVLRQYNVELTGMIYNTFIETDPVITADSIKTLRRYLARYYPLAAFAEVPRWEPGNNSPDFTDLFAK